MRFFNCGAWDRKCAISRVNGGYTRTPFAEANRTG